MRRQLRWMVSTPLAAALLATSPAIADVHLGFDPVGGLIEGTGTLAVNVTVDAAATDLRGFSLVIAFDPTVVEIDSVYAGPQLLGAACPHFLYSTFSAGADSVALDGATLGCSTAGPGTIATILFRALPRSYENYPAHTPLTWRSAILRDSDNAPIATICDPGYIDVIRPVSVDPESWARTKATYREAR